MIWILCISVIVNVILFFFALWLLAAKLMADDTAERNLEQWRVWEQRFYEAQGMALEQHELFIAPTMGEFGRMTIIDKSKGRNHEY